MLECILGDKPWAAGLTAEFDENAADDEVERLDVLRTLWSALSFDRTGRFDFRYECALPVDWSSHSGAFYETLFTFRNGKDKEFSSPELLEILDQPDLKELKRSFHLWLIFQGIQDFSTVVSDKASISCNIRPELTEDKQFKGILRTGLTIANNDLNCPQIVLEALETSPWKPESLDLLLSLQDAGIKIAIDDYGARDGHHSVETLLHLTAGMKNPSNLIVKLDGKEVRAFMEKDDPAIINSLKEVQDTCPQAGIVVEWLNSVQEVVTFEKKIRDKGIELKINYAQSRELNRYNRGQFTSAVSHRRAIG